MKVAYRPPVRDEADHAAPPAATVAPAAAMTAVGTVVSAPAGNGSLAPAAGLPKGVGLLERLENICLDQGLSGLAGRIDDMVGFVATDLAAFEIELASLPRHPRRVGKAANHLLDVGGKRLRPLCLALASRLGSGFDERALDLAIAVELVHSATLLHDDVVDYADQRRGTPTARSIYGNAASIFAGDWLLIEALRRVRKASYPTLLGDLLDVIEEMIFAESLQLECRGRLGMNRDSYFQVAEGKTASVFRWALRAGGVAGGLGAEAQDALALYGQNLGVTFQAVDDLLDLTGDPESTGKDLFTDLREGKMTLPLIFALERDGRTREVVEEVLALPENAPIPRRIAAELVRLLRTTNGVADTLELARHHSQTAIEALSAVPQGPAHLALATVAEAIVDRDV
ncbi:MAG: polyprenyl synthetase family protein [Acidobacteriota bacterium]